MSSSLWRKKYGSMDIESLMGWYKDEDKDQRGCLRLRPRCFSIFFLYLFLFFFFWWRWMRMDLTFRSVSLSKPFERELGRESGKLVGLIQL